MIVARTWAGKRYAVLGLARSGTATVRALLAGGASVVAWDADEARRDAILPGTGRGTSKAGGGGAVPGEAFAEAPLHHPSDGPPPRAGEDLVVAPLDDLTGFDALVVSPGVPLNTHPIAAMARAAGVPIIGDIELFAQARADLPPHKVVGITGTNGKSTTTALVHHILQTAGVPSLMGGNIGEPILGVDPPQAGGVYVLELSSYQIDLTWTLDCDVAVLLNVTPDHLDRYDGFEAYGASKARLLMMQTAGHLAIVGTDDAATRAIAANLRTRGDLIEISTEDFNGTPSGPALYGPHNAQNVAAARIAVARLGADGGALTRALESFTGLPHRMQTIATHKGVAFVNDSKATNPESAAPALGAFGRIHWIVGGRAKGDDLDACAPYFSNVAAAYTIGEAGAHFAEILRGRVPIVEQAGTLEAAVRDAAAAALPGDTVLLSPACASFDQFRDYEARGAAFRSAVEALA